MFKLWPQLSSRFSAGSAAMEFENVPVQATSLLGSSTCSPSLIPRHRLRCP